MFTLPSTVTSIAAKVTYGIDLVDINDKRYKMLQRILVDGEEFAIPGRFLAEAIPILRHLPMWFPGASFRRFAASLQCHVTHTMDMLYGESVQKLARVQWHHSHACQPTVESSRTPMLRETS